MVRSLLALCPALSFVLTPGRPTPPLGGCHPSWWASTAFASASRQTLNGHDCLFDLFALLAQFEQHLCDVHF
jgi:hypothetical protein